jgi:hypothetical protein
MRFCSYYRGSGTGKQPFECPAEWIASDLPKVVIKNPYITQENIYYLIVRGIGYRRNKGQESFQDSMKDSGIGVRP